MSKHNYSQYSNKNTTKAPVGTANSRADNNTVKTLEHVYETAEPAPVNTLEYIEEKVDAVTTPDTVFGTVTNCARLNVRAIPNPNGTVVCVLDANSELEIDYDNSTTEWYSVCTAAGIKGYCMRKFIAPRK